MRTWLAAILAMTFTTPAAAQWAAGAEFGVVGFGPAARDSGSDVGADRTTIIGVRVTRGNPRHAVGIRMRYGKSGVRFTDGDVSVVQEHVVKSTEVSVFGAARLVSIGRASALLVEAGPTLTIWTPSGSPTRSRGGGALALAWVVPATRGLAAVLRFETSVSGSLFDAVNDLPSGATRRTTWRQGFLVEVRRTF